MSRLRLSILAVCAATLCTGLVQAQDREAAAGHVRVIVAFKSGSEASARSAVAAARGRLALDLPSVGAAAFEIPQAALAGLQRNPNIDYVEEDAKRYPLALSAPSTTPYASGQTEPYGIRMVQADQLPQGDSLSGNRKVCIIDSGYSWGHEDLPNGPNVTGFANPALPWDRDGDGHGTHVAGTIAAINAAGTGVVGVAPNGSLKLHIMRVFGDTGAWAYVSSLVQAATNCQNAGANIISMSLGGSVSNRTEQRKFDELLAAGILPIAAAGNGGNSRTSYPAGYASVVSVAAIDVNKQRATFSQYNKDVEIAAPGAGVLSTVPNGKGLLGSLNAGGQVVEAFPLEGSPKLSASGALFDFGLGSGTNAGAANKVCLIARGSVDFAVKVSNCQASGGVGAVIYNNVAGAFSGTLGTVVTSIPSVTISQEDGTLLKATRLGQSTTMSVSVANYAYFDGTSMATPHVSAVAALVWSYFPTSCTATQLRNSLNKSAQDLGAAGRDVNFGFGLVQAKAAYDRIVALGCGN